MAAIHELPANRLSTSAIVVISSFPAIIVVFTCLIKRITFALVVVSSFHSFVNSYLHITLVFIVFLVLFVRRASLPL